MLKNIIKYYEKVTNMALVSLKNEKNFQFRKLLTNHSLLKATEDYYEKIHRSPAAKKIIDEYTHAMNNMYKLAKQEYNLTLAKLKATKDEELKQKILNDYAKNGIHGFTAKNGARWNIETYSNMYTCHINNQLLRLRVREEAKNNLFQVSDHGTICELCIPFEGKILTGQELDNSTLFHPRCKHFITEVIR